MTYKKWPFFCPQQRVKEKENSTFGKERIETITLQENRNHYIAREKEIKIT